MKPPGDTRARFEEQFTPEPNTGCWLWRSDCHRTGYGYFGVHGRGMVRAHRVAWELYRGEIPRGAFVLHRCDVRLCVNPDHLFLGDHAANMADMRLKGRSARGGRNGNSTHPERVKRGDAHYARQPGYTPRRGEDVPAAKLTWAQVAEIRGLYQAGGVSQAAIGSRYGVSQSLIHLIVTGKYWRAAVIIGSGSGGGHP